MENRQYGAIITHACFNNIILFESTKEIDDSMCIFLRWRMDGDVFRRYHDAIHDEFDGKLLIV